MYSSEEIYNLPPEPDISNDFKTITSLDLSPTPSKNYKLLDVSELDTPSYKDKYKKIVSLNLNNNNIRVLNLKDYLLLEKITASKNQLSTITLMLPRLSYLDLSNNCIQKIFNLMDIPSLRYLYLSKNQITEIEIQNLKYIKTQLLVFDICENLIKFKSVLEFLNWADEFSSTMKELQVLQINRNPFESKACFRDTYEEYLISKISKIKTLNFQMVSETRKKNKNLGVLAKEKMIAVEKDFGKDDKEIKVVNKEEETMTMKKLCNHLLLLNQRGSINDEKKISKLEELVQNYQNSCGNSGDDDEENEYMKDNELDEFEDFLDLLEKVIDSAREFDGRLYKIIASFGIIKNGKFAQRSASCIKQRISNSNVAGIKGALSVIYVYILKLKKIGKELEIPPKTIENLYFFLDETSFINPMRKILNQLLDFSDKIMKLSLRSDGSDQKPENKLCCSLIRISAEAISYNDYIEEFCNRESFITGLIKIFKFLLDMKDMVIQSEQKIQILKDALFIFKKFFFLAFEYEENFEKIKNNKFYDEETKNIKIEQNKKILDKLEDADQKIISSGIRELIEQKVNNMLSELYVPEVIKESAKDMQKRKIIYKKKQICVSLMHCYGNILSRSKDISKFLDNKGIVKKIIDMLGQNEIIDPLLIEGACTFTLGIIQNKGINTDEQKFKLISSKLYNFRCLIPLLFPDSEEFLQICYISDKYGEKAIERGHPIDTKYLNSEIINNLIISINNLMSFFGRNSRNESSIKKICKEISEEMKNLKRNQALACCLLLPDEDVKLSVVECYFSFEVEKLTSDELSSIYRQLSNLSSLSSKMQIIVSVIYLIINKWFMYNLINKEYSKINACKEAITIAINLLHRNDLKKFSGDLSKSKKKYLSVVLSNFLTNVSCFSVTRKYFMEIKYALLMGDIIESEEKASYYYTSSNFPIEIEKCFLGWSIDNIFLALEKGGITPYNYVSLRILHHIGDVLKNKRYPYFDIDYGLHYENIMITLGDESARREIERINFENGTWTEEDVMYNKSKSTFKYSVCLSKKNLEKEQTSFVEHFHKLLDLVLVRSPEKLINIYSDLWENKYYKGIDSITYSLYNLPENKKEYGQKYQSSEEFIKQESKLEERCEQNVFERFKDFLREEDYENPPVEDFGKDFNYIKGDIYYYHRYGLSGEIIRYDPENEETPNNPYIRSLFISAFLRCIYNVLKYPANVKIRDSLIKIIFERDHIRTLSLLTESTTFSTCNTASKYLAVMKLIFRNSKLFFEDKNKDECTREFLSKLGQVSYMINKIITVFRKDLTINNKEHNILLSEVCECSSIIMNLLSTLNFKTQKIGEVTLSTMININLINVLIFIIKEFMNQDDIKEEQEEEQEEQNKKSNLGLNWNVLKEMTETSKIILGEYITLCRPNKYLILESLTRSYTFDKCKLRKIFIKEILRNAKLCKIKKILPLGVKILLKCKATVYKEEEPVCKKKYFLYILDNNFILSDISNVDLREYDKIKMEETYSFEVESIHSIYSSNYPNKIWIKTLDSSIGDVSVYEITFKCRNSAKMLKDILLEINNHIKCFNNLIMFPSEKIAGELKEMIEKERIEKQEELEKKEKEKDKENTPKPKNKEILIDENEEEEDVEIDNESKGIKKPFDPNWAVVLCKYKGQSLTSFFGNITSFLKCNGNIEAFNDPSKIIVIRDNKLTIFEEKKSETFSPFQFIELCDRNKSVDKWIDITQIILQMYTEITKFEVKDFTSLKLDGSDNLVFYKNNDEKLRFKIHDDPSFGKFKQLIPVIDNTIFE